MMLTKNFSEKEMQCPCCKQQEMRTNFMEALQKLREEYGRPMIVTSGYRCKKHNEKVGGAKTSQHLRGNAVDIKCARHERYRLIQLALRHGFTGIEFSSKHVHLDRRAWGTVFLAVDNEGTIF